MKNLVIIGARGFGREVFNLATKCDDYNKAWTIKGFLDDKADALDGFEGYPAVLGPVETYEPQADDVFACALGEVEFRKKYAQMILDKGGKFINIIHPACIMLDHIKLGYGLVINAYTSIGNDTSIGNFVIIQSHVAIGHDVIIGDWSVVNSFSFMGGFVKIGDGVTLGPGSKIMPKKTVGEYATVGIGSIVTKNVHPKTTVFGSPAREIL